jgi:hypothetical protein
MSSISSRLAVAISRSFLSIVAGAFLIITLNPDALRARPIERVLPRPFVMNRGDGDAINGRYFFDGNSNQGDALTPPQTSAPAGDNERYIPMDLATQIKILRWILLYQLLK